MFYSLSLLSKKGPLGTIWIAAYCFKRLKRSQIASTDISSAVDKIIPETQISHRVLAQLLFGIVKIFSKKVDFLYDECNVALYQMRKFLPSTQRIALKKASARPRKGDRDSEDVTYSIDHGAKTMKEVTTEQLIETMLASYHEVTVNLPERFELDSFDLGILDDGNNSGSHQHSTPPDEWKDKRSRPSYLDECLTNDVASLLDYKSSCFTPLADVLPSSMMDIDLELSDSHNNSSNFSSVQRSLEKFHLGGENEKQVCLSGSMPLHDEIQENHIPLNHEQTVPSVRDEILPVEEQRNLTEIANVQGKNNSSMIDVDLELSDTHNSCNFASVQKSLEEFHHGGDFEKQVCLSGTVPLHDVIGEIHIPLNHEQTEPSVGDQNPPVEENRNLTESIYLKKELPSESGKDNLISEKHADAPSYNQKPNFSGTVSPKFMVATPAIKESSRVLRKRKKKYDESIILSNKFMSQSIHDASDLVCERRKLPQTDLDIWKLWRFSKPCQSFTDPIISFSSPAPEKLPQKKPSQLSKKSADGLIDSANVKDRMHHNESSIAEIETDGSVQILDKTPQHSKQNLEENSHYLLKESATDHIDPTNMEDSMPHLNNETETEVLIQKLDRTCSTPSKSSESRANSLENLSQEFTSPDALDYQFETLELCFRGDNIGEQANGWSPSTWAAAQYLYNRSLRFRKQKQDAALSLAQILEGKTKATCARFIYETLTLKTYGCIDVRQDFPCGDVLLSAKPALKSFHKVSM